ncbi:MAG: ABC transporter ATP-binding protein [Opitutales bacterium]|nr:ABC transporter ATP-binding protein [Opitutales bacterium]
MEELSENPNSVIVRRLTKSYGSVKAIENVSFRIGRGEVVGFLGPNGAGKSTTMRIIAGLMPATSGSVHICGISVANNADMTRKHIAFMPENNPLPEELRVGEYLKFRAEIKGVPKSEIRSRVDEVMDICQLKRTASKKIIGNLSKGFRQRVGIADAILSRPDVIILDEPTIGLDPHQILAIRELICSLRGKMSVIISSHILPEIELVCDRVIIINQGTVVASGSPQSLRKDFIPYDRYEVSLKASREVLEDVLKRAELELEIESASEQSADGYVDYILKAPQNSNLGAKIISELSKDAMLTPRQVAYKAPTLEEIFMSATRRSWEQLRGLNESSKMVEEIDKESVEK